MNVLLLALLLQPGLDPDLKPTDPNKTAAAPRTAPPEKSPAKTPAAAKTAAPPAKTAADETEPDEEDEESGGKTFGDWWDEISKEGALGLLLKGGVFMFPILILGIVAAGVIIERWRSLKMLTTDAGDVRRQVRDLLAADRVEEALALCDRERGPVPAILGSGLRKYLVLTRLGYDAGQVQRQVTEAMDDYSVHVVAALEKHLPILATSSSAAPMLGFLGTVSGMIVSFDEITAKMGSGKNIVELAAGGISVALLTTAFGLIVGIPAFIAFNYYSGVINRFILEVEESAAELIETVTLQLALESPQPSANGDAADVSEATTVVPVKTS